MLKKSIFEKNKFNSKYQIIGDFDFFLKLSQKHKFCCVQKSLSYYRQHNDNFSSKKSSLYVYELLNWIKNNENHRLKNFNFTKIKRYSIFKMKPYMENSSIFIFFNRNY